MIPVYRVTWAKAKHNHMMWQSCCPLVSQKHFVCGIGQKCR